AVEDADLHVLPLDELALARGKLGNGADIDDLGHVRFGAYSYLGDRIYAFSLAARPAELADSGRPFEQAQRGRRDLGVEPRGEARRDAQRHAPLDRHVLRLGVLRDAVLAVAATRAGVLEAAHRGVDRPPPGRVALVD